MPTKSHPILLSYAVIFCVAVAGFFGYFVYKDFEGRYYAEAKPALYGIYPGKIVSKENLKTTTLVGLPLDVMCRVVYRWEAWGNAYQGIDKQPFCFRYQLRQSVRVSMSPQGYHLALSPYELIGAVLIMAFAVFGLNEAIRRFRGSSGKTA